MEFVKFVAKFIFCSNEKKTIQMLGYSVYHMTEVMDRAGHVDAWHHASID